MVCKYLKLKNTLTYGPDKTKKHLSRNDSWRSHVSPMFFIFAMACGKHCFQEQNTFLKDILRLETRLPVCHGKNENIGGNICMHALRRMLMKRVYSSADPLRRCYTGQLATSIFRATLLREKSNTVASF